MASAKGTLQSKGVEMMNKLGNGNFGEGNSIERDAIADGVVWSGMYKGQKVAVKFLQKAGEESLGEIKQELGFLGYDSDITSR